MEVILREDIDKLGARGQVVKVAAGYARNYLLPKKLAMPASEANKKVVEQERLAHVRREAKEISSAQDLSGMLTGVTVTFARKPANRSSCSARSPRRTSPKPSNSRATTSTGGRSIWTSPSSSSANTRSPSACTAKSPPRSWCGWFPKKPNASGGAGGLAADGLG